MKIPQKRQASGDPAKASAKKARLSSDDDVQLPLQLPLDIWFQIARYYIDQTILETSQRRVRKTLCSDGTLRDSEDGARKDAIIPSRPRLRYHVKVNNRGGNTVFGALVSGLSWDLRLQILGYYLHNSCFILDDFDNGQSSRFAVSIRALRESRFKDRFATTTIHLDISIFPRKSQKYFPDATLRSLREQEFQRKELVDGARIGFRGPATEKATYLTRLTRPELGCDVCLVFRTLWCDWRALRAIYKARRVTDQVKWFTFELQHPDWFCKIDAADQPPVHESLKLDIAFYQEQTIAAVKNIWLPKSVNIPMDMRRYLVEHGCTGFNTTDW